VGNAQPRSSNQHALPLRRCFTIGNVQLRNAEPTDAMAGARVHVRSWQAAYRKLVPDARAGLEDAHYTLIPITGAEALGLRLRSAARARLLNLGFRKVLLWVLEGNVRAERFYRRDQWARMERSERTKCGGLKVREVRYRRNLEEITVAGENST
jgi:hypothetical protein